MTRFKMCRELNRPENQDLKPIVDKLKTAKQAIDDQNKKNNG